MDDFLLLIDGLMKVAFVVCIMVLVATAPSGASAAAAGHGHEGARFAGLLGASAAHRDDGGSMRYAFEDDDDDFAGHSALDQTNVMSTGAHDHEADRWRDASDHDSHRSTLIETDPFEHSFNIDGTPMCGSVDIHGNIYGVTDWHCNDSWGGGTSSMFD